MQSFIDALIPNREYFYFNVYDLYRLTNNSIRIDIIANYLSMVSRTSRFLSDLSNQFPYNVSDIGIRLSPLERYNIVKLDNTFIVPNIRYFACSINNIPRFELQELYPNNEFNETYGSIFELYIGEVLESFFNKNTIIPEIRYKKSKNYIDGPDFTIIDEQNNALYVIEVKSKSTRVNTRLSPTSMESLNDLRRGIDALEKLPGKIEDLYKGIGEYEVFKERIESIQRERIICILIISQGITLMPEVIETLISSIPNHFLRTFPYKYCIMDIENFEKALNIAVSGKKSIYDLLDEYHRLLKSEEPKSHMAEMFGGFNSEPKLPKLVYFRQHIKNIIEDKLKKSF